MTTTPITGDTWGDEIEGPRAFILAQAEKPFADLKPVFEAAHGRLVAQLDGVSAEAIAAALPADSALVDFVCYDRFDFRAVPAAGDPHWKEPCSLAFVVRAR